MKKILLVLSLLLLLSINLPLAAQTRVDVQQYHVGADDIPLWHNTRLQQDHYGLIWIGTWNGLYRFDGSEFYSFKPEPSNESGVESDRVRDILMLGGDTLLCRIEETIWMFNVKTCRYDSIASHLQSHYRQIMTDGLSDMLIPSADVTLGGETFKDIKQHMVDQQGVHWLLNPNNIYCVRLAERRGDNIDPEMTDVMQYICHDMAGNYWMCTRPTGIIAIYDEDFNRKGFLAPDGTLKQKPVEFTHAYYVYDDKQGNIWIGAKPEGLYRLRPRDNGYEVKHIDRKSVV